MFGAVPDDVWVAVVGLVSTVIAVTIPVIAAASRANRQSAQRLAKLEAKLDTNHGKRPGEYLEMIHDVLANVVDIQRTLLEHTHQDEVRFTELQSGMDHLRDEVGRAA